ncbi:hypothetical protein FOL47_009848 [Perkinsus chesapeaki]|uniref:Uncharacterized protein n=1 Tax=Perkinsus chesapeaki TaxID=330153 RepID=A0A7J6L679_PERCH|nr:hypothetical protein FOL47_009848 [Perkinsus chesapeaki]
MLQLAGLAASLSIFNIKAEDIVVFDDVYPIQLNLSVAPVHSPDNVIESPPYTKPTGSCTWDGKQLHDCHCPTGRYTFVGLIDGKVGAGMCLAHCSGGLCPYLPGKLTKCINGLCFVDCYHSFRFNAGDPYNYLCLYRMDTKDSGSG